MGRNLLVCFDAFDTLYRLKRPVQEVYLEMIVRHGDAKRHFRSGFEKVPRAELLRELRDNFYAAYRAQDAQFPYYGAAQGLGAQAWWYGVLNETFRPYFQRGVSALSSDALARLYRHFGDCQPYDMDPMLPRALRALKQSCRYDRTVVGVLSNSDARATSVLAAFGLGVSCLRYGFTEADVRREEVVRRHRQARFLCHHTPRYLVPPAGPLHLTPAPWGLFDVDFACLAEDTHMAKPELGMWARAEDMVPAAVQYAAHERWRLRQRRRAAGEAWTYLDDTCMPGSLEGLGDASDTESWDRVHVGNEWRKDAVPAREAGWLAILIGPQNDPKDLAAGMPAKLPRIEDEDETSVAELAAKHGTLGSASTAAAVQWLANKAVPSSVVQPVPEAIKAARLAASRSAETAAAEDVVKATAHAKDGIDSPDGQTDTERLPKPDASNAPTAPSMKSDAWMSVAPGTPEQAQRDAADLEQQAAEKRDEEIQDLVAYEFHENKRLDTNHT